MKDVYMVSGGVSTFRKARHDATFQKMVKEAYDYAMNDLPALSPGMIDGSVGSYFSDHFTRQLMAGIMVTDYLGLCPKPNKRIEGGGATGGLCFQSAWESIASGRMKVCLAFGFEVMSHVETWKGNEFIALPSDTNYDYPVGGVLFRVLRHDGEQAYARVRNTCGTDGDGIGEKPHERLSQPLRPETEKTHGRRREEF